MIFYIRSETIKENLIAEIRKLRGTWKVSISVPRRSLEQNDFVHTLIAEIAPHTPHDAYTLKEILKAKLLGVKYAEFQGKQYVIANKTSTLNKHECSLFIEELLMLADELSIDLKGRDYFGYANNREGVRIGPPGATG